MNQSEVDRLVELAGGEDRAVQQLEFALAQLRAAKDAQALLQRLPADELRPALEARTRGLLRVVS